MVAVCPCHRHRDDSEKVIVFCMLSVWILLQVNQIFGGRVQVLC